MIRALLLAFALAACGFRPMYGDAGGYGSSLSSAASRIAIAPVRGYDGTYGVDLRNSLFNKLAPGGRPADPRYALDIDMREPSITDYTIKDDGTASSYLVRISADYRLFDRAGHGVVLARSASAEMSYNILKDQYSTEMLKQNAVKMVIESISEQIYLSIITYFAEG